MHESGREFMEGMWESVTIERSAAGRPGIMIVMERRDGDLMEDQMVVTVKDGLEFLRPVFEWLMGADLPKVEREARCPYSHELGRCGKCGWSRAEVIVHKGGRPPMDDDSWVGNNDMIIGGLGQ